MEITPLGKCETKPWMSEVDREGFKASNKSTSLATNFLLEIHILKIWLIFLDTVEVKTYQQLYSILVDTFYDLVFYIFL